MQIVLFAVTSKQVQYCTVLRSRDGCLARDDRRLWYKIVQGNNFQRPTHENESKMQRKQRSNVPMTTIFSTAPLFGANYLFAQGNSIPNK